jgi:hypothetical protein
MHAHTKKIISETTGETLGGMKNTVAMPIANPNNEN